VDRTAVPKAAATVTTATAVTPVTAAATAVTGGPAGMAAPVTGRRRISPSPLRLVCWLLVFFCSGFFDEKPVKKDLSG
jgi:hypothetical protein